MDLNRKGQSLESSGSRIARCHYYVYINHGPLHIPLRIFRPPWGMCAPPVRARHSPSTAIYPPHNFAIAFASSHTMLSDTFQLPNHKPGMNFDICSWNGIYASTAISSRIKSMLPGAGRPIAQPDLNHYHNGTKTRPPYLGYELSLLKSSSLVLRVNCQDPLTARIRISTYQLMCISNNPR